MTPEEEALIGSHIISLQARIDALMAAVEILYLGHGSSREKFHSTIQSLIDASKQKRLEHIEGQSPISACAIAERLTVQSYDQKLIDALRFDDAP